MNQGTNLFPPPGMHETHRLLPNSLEPLRTAMSVFSHAALSRLPLPLQAVLNAPRWFVRDYDSLGAMLLSCNAAVNYRTWWDHVLAYVVGWHAAVRRWLSVF